MLYLFFIACYGVYKKNRQAYFVVIGWFVLYISWLLMYLSSVGLFQIFEYFPYIIETGILFEAIIFSIALADRINTLKSDKELANENLIVQQQSEEKRLKEEVKHKTQNLNLALNEKELLLRELNHRVKNNMQMVVSLLRLQSNDIDDEKLKDIFKTAQNRINAMGHLHELLYKQDNFTHINSFEYFSLLIEEIDTTSTKDIEINFDIKCDLKMEDAIYCGLILNELVSNSFKYAFEKEGKIDINLYKDEKNYILKVQDDGRGFDTKEKRDSLGLSLIEALVTKQLKGDLHIDATDGVKVMISWKEK